jgi:hypothetical protein
VERVFAGDLSVRAGRTSFAPGNPIGALRRFSAPGAYDASMVDLPVGEPLETLIEEPDGSLQTLAAATNKAEVSSVAAAHPECLSAWAWLGEDALAEGRDVEAYAYFRVGYHRGLDRIRRAGWRGSGKVPWAHEGNRGFLRSLRGLGQAADAISEDDEASRCSEFFAQLAPDAP